jgi:hypothetical protein
VRALLAAAEREREMQIDRLLLAGLLLRSVIVLSWFTMLISSSYHDADAIILS